MRVLLDTNVISEQQKPYPAAEVDRFIQDAPEDALYLSVTTIAELHRGIALMAPGRRRNVLSDWIVTDLPARFGERLLPVTLPVAKLWGEMMAHSRRSGLNVSVMDGFIAATAAAPDLVIATRNDKHFVGLGVSVINPWAER
jgi:predicted nucleic acid-binding protein